MITNKRLANQTRFLFIATPFVLLLIIAVPAYFTLMTLMTDASLQLTRQHAIEANLDFQRFLTPHKELARQTARSYGIARWIDDIENDTYRNRAFLHINHFHKFNPDVTLMFTSKEGELNYIFEGHQTLVPVAEHVQVATLADRSLTEWFWFTLECTPMIHLSVQPNQEPHETRFWVNQRVYFYGEAVGVVSVGFLLYDLMETMFHDLHPDVTVHLVSNNGTIQIDSRYPGHSYRMRIGRPEHLADTDYDPQILEKVLRLSESLDNVDDSLPFSVGLFPLDVEIGNALELHTGDYAFAAVLPLADTSWLTVVLSNHQGMIANHLIIAMASVFVFSVILMGIWGHIIVKRNILNPFERLFISMSNLPQLKDPTSEAPIFIDGSERKDEIGELARHIEGVLDSLQQANLEAQRVAVLEETNNAKSRFLARMSHEIRTPISAILGISEAQIKRVDLDDYTKDAIYKIYTSGNLLLGIINDILDLSRIEHGDMPIIESKYQVASMISDTMQRHLGTAVSKGLSFNVAVSPELPAYLIGDLLRIQQVLNNILSNAFKYTLTGEVSVSFGLSEPVIDGQTNLRVSVADTGIGMTPEQVAAIFDEYSRFSEKEYRNIDGTGLGMFIVHHLLELMYGTVEIASEKGKGTTVSFTLPQKNIGDDILGAMVAKNLQQFNDSIYQSITLPTFTVEPLPHGRVLIVDDLDVNLYVAAELLAMYQLSVLDTAKSGQEALERIAEGHTYDVIFMDHMMPELDGVETLAILRKQGYSRPVVALTANAMVGSEEKFLSQGFDDFLSKPIQTKLLHQVLGKFIQPDSTATPSTPTPVVSQADKNRALRNKIIADFQKNQARVVDSVEQAIEQQDNKTVHLLVHSLKGVAGLLGEGVLAQFATDMESDIRMGTLPERAQLGALRSLMDTVLSKLAAELAVNANAQAQSAAVSDIEQLSPLLDELAPLIANSSTKALLVAESLRAYPEAEALYQALEEFEFDTALKELHALRNLLDTH